MDLPIQNMPRFRIFESSIVRCTLPYDKDTTKVLSEESVMLDVRYDVKVALTFSNKLAIPPVALYDAKERISIQQLQITFTHDKYNVMEVKYNIIYGPRIKRLDPSHPSLTAFEIVYSWESVQEDDFPFAIQVMFCLALLVFICISALIVENHRSFVGNLGKTAYKRVPK